MTFIILIYFDSKALNKLTKRVPFKEQSSDSDSVYITIYFLRNFKDHMPIFNDIYF